MLEQPADPLVALPEGGMAAVRKLLVDEFLVSEPKGGFGPVYRTMWNNSVCAVKRLSCDCIDAPGLLAELRTIQSREHENKLPVLTYYHEQRFLFLVSPYYSGGSVESTLARSPTILTCSTRLSIAVGVASAIQHFHEAYSKPIIHGRLKSSNVLLDVHLIPKVSDYGLVRYAQCRSPGGEEIAGNTTITSADGRVKFDAQSPSGQKARAYLPPESLEMYPNSEYTTRADVFALGVVLYELCTGLPAYDPGRLATGGAARLKEHVEDLKDEPSQLVDPRIGWNSDISHTGLLSTGHRATRNLSRRPNKDRPDARTVCGALKDVCNRHAMAVIASSSGAISGNDGAAGGQHPPKLKRPLSEESRSKMLAFLGYKVPKNPFPVSNGSALYESPEDYQSESFSSPQSLTSSVGSSIFSQSVEASESSNYLQNKVEGASRAFTNRKEPGEFPEEKDIENAYLDIIPGDAAASPSQPVVSSPKFPGRVSGSISSIRSSVSSTSSSVGNRPGRTKHPSVGYINDPSPSNGRSPAVPPRDTSPAVPPRPAYSFEEPYNLRKQPRYLEAVAVTTAAKAAMARKECISGAGLDPGWVGDDGDYEDADEKSDPEEESVDAAEPYDYADEPGDMSFSYPPEEDGHEYEDMPGGLPAHLGRRQSGVPTRPSIVTSPVDLTFPGHHRLFATPYEQRTSAISVALPQPHRPSSLSMLANPGLLLTQQVRSSRLPSQHSAPAPAYPVDYVGPSVIPYTSASFAQGRGSLNDTYRLSNTKLHVEDLPPMPAIRSQGSHAGAASQGSRAGAVSPGIRAGAVSPGIRVGAASQGSRAGAVSPGSRAGVVSLGSRAGSVSPGIRAGTVSSGIRAGAVSPGVPAGAVSPGSRARAVSTGVGRAPAPHPVYNSGPLAYTGPLFNTASLSYTHPVSKTGPIPSHQAPPPVPLSPRPGRRTIEGDSRPVEGVYLDIVPADITEFIGAVNDYPSDDEDELLASMTSDMGRMATA